MGKKTKKLKKLAETEDLIDPNEPTTTRRDASSWMVDDKVLTEAVLKGNYSRVQEILQKGNVPIDAKVKSCEGKTALHLACERGYLDVAKLLLENGADLVARDNRGDTPLHSVFAIWDYRDVVEFLIEETSNHGKNAINIQNNDGITPLLLCCWKGDVTVFNLLLKNAAD